jgi:uroporphyrinogen-III synthase
MMRVIVTRPEGDAQGWVDGLQAAGLAPVALPLINIAPVADRLELELAWCWLDDYIAVMFVSGNAVTHFFKEKPPVTLVRTAFPAPKTRAWATGPGTRQALLQAGVDAGLIDAPALDADQFDSQALWAQVRNQVHPGARVLIVRGASVGTMIGPDANDGADTQVPPNWLAGKLTQAGARVDFLAAYLRVAPTFSAQQKELVQQAASDGSIWLFTSSEAVLNLAAALPGQVWSDARAVATHVRIADTARRVGFGVVCESRPQLASVVASIESMR